MEITHRYTTLSGKKYSIRMVYNQKIGDTDPSTEFVRTIDVVDSQTNASVALPVKASRFSTFEDYTTFGSYCAINYLGVREAAIGALRTKVLTRLEDALEKLG